MVCGRIMGGASRPFYTNGPRPDLTAGSGSVFCVLRQGQDLSPGIWENNGDRMCKSGYLQEKSAS